MLKFRLWGTVLWLGLALIVWGQWPLRATAATDPATEVKAAYVVDANSGQAIYADHADKKLPIASLSKLMTLYLVTQAVRKGQVKWTDNVPISADVRKLAASPTLSTMPMAKDEKFTVKELFAATLVGSSNSSAIALGELIGGSNAKFIQLMNQQAARWQLAAHFVSASGLDNTDLIRYHYNLPGTSNQAQNLVSARAITTVARQLIKDYPAVIDIANHGSIKIHRYRVATLVQILKGQKHYDAAVPVDGLKTGYTAQAGACLVATFKQGGRRLIATTLGGTWKYTANAKLRLQTQQQERYHNVAPATMKYRLPGTQTTLKLVAKSSVKRWENVQQPFRQTQTAAVPVQRQQVNYLAANTTVMRLRLTDPNSGTVTTVAYVSPKAQMIPGPMQQVAKATATKHQLNLPLAFAN
ncbi:serine hydrolase [Lactiplantibacillus sp. WILCCON 0030]|uniref:Serine hydrolase n=1 Tax=Lactiplantibacillus brownii TaxID=3069269 RepID=A0ABU1A819_9LACO|nr:serine hydrolase [Lactiplantibacillus brownii]MDQ7937021.1 serine hydrolase [Lactiplantibacillus brownii]